MAICSFIKESKQTAGAMAGVIRYVSQKQKTVDENGTRYLTGVNCVADLAQQTFMATKNLYGKATGTFFYQYVQSFSLQEQIIPAEAHKIALELAEKFFPGCEVLVATHIDTEHLHSHFIVNSVHPDTGQKLRFTPKTLEQMRQLSDLICAEHGLSTLKPYRQDRKTKGLRTGEYRAAVRGESWKFQLIAAIETTMERVGSREDFIQEMRRQGYEVRWEANRKSITYTTPSGMKCRDDRLHERKFRKEKMEDEFRIRRRAAQQRINQFETAGTDAPNIDGPAAQRPLHNAHADSGTAGGGAAENAGIAGAHPHIHGGIGDQREPELAGNVGRTVGLGEPGTGTQSADISIYGRSFEADEGGEPTGWEDTRRVYEETLRYGAAVPGGWGGHAEHFPALDPADIHRGGSGIYGVHHPDADPGAVTEEIIHLLSRLEGGTENQVMDNTTQRQRGDRKALSREREKKIAMGHKADDHEEGQKMM